MMAKRRKGLSERHKKILAVLERYQNETGYPPSIREIGKQTGISSTSVVNYYLNQLEEEGYIERDRKISRGVGRIVAGQPMPVPSSDFAYYDQESGVEIARSLLAPGDKEEDLFALEVQGDSMVDAMVNDGDIVVMKRAQDARNGEMVAVWLRGRDHAEILLQRERQGPPAACQPNHETNLCRQPAPGSRTRQSRHGHPPNGGRPLG
jgi:repressor LexA